MPDEYTTPGAPVTKASLRKKLPAAGTTPPSDPEVGQLWVDTNPYTAPPPTTVGLTAPSNPQVGDLWIDTNPYPRTTVGPTAPSNPTVNDIWIDTNA